MKRITFMAAALSIMAAAEAQTVKISSGEDVVEIVMDEGSTIGYSAEGVLSVTVAGEEEQTYSVGADDRVDFLPKIESESELKAVDLGLESGTLWANMNLGATTSEGYGSYFMWGHTEASSGACTAEDCATDGVEDIVEWQGDVNYDAAAASTDGEWVTPTDEQIMELVSGCVWVRVSVTNGAGEEILGYKVSSKSSDSYIFLPMGGGLFDNGASGVGEYGHYWSSTPMEDAGKAYHLGLAKYYFGRDGYERVSGFNIRAVAAKK